MTRTPALLLLAVLCACKPDPPAPAAPSPAAPDGAGVATPESLEAPPVQMAPDAGSVPVEAPAGIPDRDNAAIRDASFGTWDTASVAACDTQHESQLKTWVLTLCRAKIEADVPAARLAGAVELPQIAVPFSAPESTAVFLWNDHSTEVPDRASIGGRKARFRDNDKDSSFHPETIRAAAAANTVDLPVLAVEGTRPVREVAEALEIFRSAGHKKVALAFDTTAYPIPAPPDPTGLDQMPWQTAAPYMREAMKGCAPMSDVLEAFSTATPETRCTLLADRIPSAMTSCKCQMADRHAFLRNLQLFIKPPKIVTVVVVGLSGEKTQVKGGQPWSEAAAALFKSPRTDLHLIAR